MVKRMERVSGYTQVRPGIGKVHVKGYSRPAKPITRSGIHYDKQPVITRQLLSRDSQGRLARLRKVSVLSPEDLRR